jgi:Icc-related predicted phosphoesterase
MSGAGAAAGAAGGAGDANGVLRVAAVADLHVHKVHRGEYRALFTELSTSADVVCLCGDLTNFGLPEEAENLIADLAALSVPAVAVLGNHDMQSGQAEEVKKVLRRGNIHFLDEEPFTHRGVGFAGVKGFGGGFGKYMLSAFGEDATKHFVAEAVNESLVLENGLRRLGTERNIVVLHYSPIAETVRGEPVEIFPFLGCSRLAETIDRFEKIRAVFHGHAHHGQPHGQTPKGIPVYNCSVQVQSRAGGKGYVAVEV